MFAVILKRFSRDRRAATALVLTLMFVPMLIAGGAAVDFSRISSARAELQMAADSAALAGVGTYQNMAYQNLASSSQAAAVAQSDFASSTINVSNYVKINTKTVTVGCNGTAVTNQCGSGGTATCSNAQFYCVTVTASATMMNSLLATFIPSEALSVTARASTGQIIGAGNFKSTNVANAYDSNWIYAYGVPLNPTTGASEYSALPDPTASCLGPVTNGILAQEITQSSTPGGGACPYYAIGSSSGSISSTQSSISLGYQQPVAFLFVNVTGNSTGYGYVPVGTGTNAIGTGTGAGFCPNWTLYGSISQVPNSVTPLSDSTNIYSSAYEKFGLPPTYSSTQADEALASDPNGIQQPFGTNHAITSFSVPVGTDVGNQNINTAYGTATFYVNKNGNANAANNVSLTSKNGYTKTTSSQDPSNVLYYQYGGNYATTQYNSNYSAVYGNASTVVTNEDFKTTVAFQCPQQSNWNATYYPNNQYYSSVSGTSGPAVVSGCTPTNPPASPGTWNFSGSNLNNCSTDDVTFGTEQSSNFNNCALLIQDLGTGVTSLPESYTVVNGTGSFTDSSNNTTTFPQTYLTPNKTYPSGSNEYWLPDSTAHKCYDPSAGYDAANGAFADTLATAKSYDAIEDPNDGAVVCNSTPPKSYGLYWNDMGSTQSDDLGYWNAITLFTCSTPAGSGGPATLTQ